MSTTTEPKPKVQSAVTRTYVVLEEVEVYDVVIRLLDEIEVGLDHFEIDKLRAAVGEQKAFQSVCDVEARNSSHALKQVGRGYDAGVSPPLVAVSTRMWQPRTVTVELEPSVRVG